MVSSGSTTPFASCVRGDYSPALSRLPPPLTAAATAPATTALAAGVTVMPLESAAEVPAATTGIGGRSDNLRPRAASDEEPPPLWGPGTAAAAFSRAKKCNEDVLTVLWWQTCRRCRETLVKAPAELGRFGDLPFARFLDMVLADETLRGDGTCTGGFSTLHQQQQQRQDQLLQHQQQQKGHVTVECCRHLVFRDRIFYFLAGNAVRAVLRLLQILFFAGFGYQG